MKRITLNNLCEVLDAGRKAYQQNYFAMYSSLLGGVVVDPVLMALPIDDHMVHRGDGVFDTCKCVNGAIYNLSAHLDRLDRSAAAVGLAMPLERTELVNTVIETVRAGENPDCAVRILLSRGPGSFSCCPYDSPEPAIYVIVSKLGQPFMERKSDGVTVAVSTVPAKPPFFAGVKNCNYLPNVMMKREAADWGVDFVIGLDHHGFLAEGPTENMGIVTPEGELLFPRLDNVLCGTTMMRVLELARSAVSSSGPLTGVDFRDISVEAARGASEMLIVCTTHNVVQAREFDGVAVGSVPGPVYSLLSDLVTDDVLHNTDMRTEIFCYKG